MSVSRQPYREVLEETTQGLKEKANDVFTEYSEGDYVSIDGELHRVDEARAPDIASVLDSFGKFVLTGELELQDTYRFTRVEEDELPENTEVYEVDSERIDWYV